MTKKPVTSKASTKPTNSSKTKAKKKPSAPQSSKISRIEGRNDHRIPIQLLVDYRANGHYLFDFCKDLGSGGVFIQTQKPLPKGSEIDLTFTIPDSKETLEASGHVIWVQAEVSGRDDLTPGMGVQFNGFQDGQRRLLEDFVSRYHGDRYLATKKKLA
jgi:uncharacterized protein (TIGR02266 family)